MQFSELKFLADENIDPDLILFMRQRTEVVSVADILPGSTDRELLTYGNANGLAILTHDSDFGNIVHFEGIYFISILYLRPGHIDVDFHIKTMEALYKLNPEIPAKSIVTAKSNTDILNIRIRTV